VIFNRTYQLRSRRGGLVSVGEVIGELVERADGRRRFYRPGRRPKLGAKAKESLQLELFPQEPVPRDAERPLFDLLPEAYDDRGREGYNRANKGRELASSQMPRTT
jgi:hypothetical protein